MGKNNLRNKPCPCGSGKKFKHCCMNRRPRNTSVTMDMGKPVVVNGIRMSPNGTVELLSNGTPLTPESAYHDISYERRKGPKILNKTPLDPKHLLMDSHIALKKFDLIFALDTNTKTVNGETISVCCTVLCKLTFNENEMIAEYAPIHCMEFRNIKELAENIAWMKAVQMIIANPAYSSELRIGLVVDSNLGNLHAYNERTAPIYADFFLPKNFLLTYASADVGKEFILNQLISLCEKEAKRLLEDIASNEIPNDNLQVVDNEPYSHFRLWNKS